MNLSLWGPVAVAAAAAQIAGAPHSTTHALGLVRERVTGWSTNSYSSLGAGW
jgi:hypothetical protein